MYRDRSLHRRRNVQGQFITQEKECTGTDHYKGEGMYRNRSLQSRGNVQILITKERTNKLLKSEQLTRTFAVLVSCKDAAQLIPSISDKTR